MPSLNSDQLKQYEDQGYISPIEVLSSSEALEARKEIETLVGKKVFLTTQVRSIKKGQNRAL